MTDHVQTALVNEIIAKNPYTQYAFTANEHACEQNRAEKYARMVANEALRAHPAIGTPDNVREALKEIASFQEPFLSSTAYVMRDKAKSALAAIGRPDNAREALQKAREEIVLTIAFLGRDAGTDRIGGTIKGLIERLAKADAAVIKALAAIPREQEAKPVAWHWPVGPNGEKWHYRLGADKPTFTDLAEPLYASPPSDSPGSGWPPQFEPMKLQARPADGGDWIDIFPGQLEWMAKEGNSVRAIEQPGSAHQPQGGDARGDCAKICDAALAQVRDEYSQACNDEALSETGREAILHRLSAQADAIESLSNQIRATPPAPVRAAACPTCGKADNINCSDSFHVTVRAAAEPGEWLPIDTRPDNYDKCWIGNCNNRWIELAYPDKRMPRWIWRNVETDKMLSWKPDVWMPFVAPPPLPALSPASANEGSGR